MMSRKDYQAVAEIVKEAGECYPMDMCDSPTESIASRETIRFMALRMAKMFRADNSLFRAVTFFEACGLNDIASLVVLM